ncbi:MAG: hypothetical protein P1V81_07085 [Planctomycetota bacterium]|nr:hypothetical protein [Planctomycetota bacterium]
MSSPLQIDPNLEEILRDIAAAPSSRLFPGLDAARIPGIFQARARDLGTTTPGLSSAERELLRLHRRELSRVLRQAFDLHFFADKDLSKRATTDKAPKLLAVWEQDARFTRDFAPVNTFGFGTAQLLSHLLDGGGVDGTSAFVALANAAARMDDSPLNNQRIAIALDAGDQPHSAVRVLARTIRATPKSQIRLETQSLCRVSLTRVAGQRPGALDLSRSIVAESAQIEARRVFACEYAFLALDSFGEAKEPLLQRHRDLARHEFGAIATWMRAHQGTGSWTPLQGRTPEDLLDEACWLMRLLQGPSRVEVRDPVAR